MNYELIDGDVVFARTGGAGSFGVVKDLKERVVFASYLIRFRFQAKFYEHDYTTVYTIPDLRAYPLNSQNEIGKQVRSFQVAIERLRIKPDLAKLLIHKPGPLSDEIPRLNQLANVYLRGLNEVAQLIRDVKTTPS